MNTLPLCGEGWGGGETKQDISCFFPSLNESFPPSQTVPESSRPTTPVHNWSFSGFSAQPFHRAAVFAAKVVVRRMRRSWLSVGASRADAPLVTSPMGTRNLVPRPFSLRSHRCIISNTILIELELSCDFPSNFQLSIENNDNVVMLN